MRLGMLFLMLLVGIGFSGAGIKPAFKAEDYPGYQVSSKVFQLDQTRIQVHQVKNPGALEGPLRYCRAWVNVFSGEGKLHALFFPELNPYGDAYGLFVPKDYQKYPFFPMLKLGDYDGRLILVYPDGAVFTMPGGAFFPSKENRRYLFIAYHSDIGGVTVFDTAERKVLLSQTDFSFPSPETWYQKGAIYFFVAPADSGQVVYWVDVNNKKLKTDPNVRGWMAGASAVKYEFEPLDYPDCAL